MRRISSNFFKNLTKYFRTSQVSPLKISLPNAIATSITVILTIVNLTILAQQNILVEKSWRLSQDNLGFEIDTRSQNYTKQAYDDLYLDIEVNSTISDLKNNRNIENEERLRKVVDIFEEVGSNFCQGTAKARHIRIYLANTLGKIICDNQQVNEKYSGKKNGTAILCYEFFPDSLFAKTLKKDNLSTCEFLDSNTFDKTNNRERFELQ